VSATQPAGGATAAWGTRELWLVGGASLAALIYDPLAPAAASKRAVLLLVGLAALLAGLWRPAVPARPLPRAALWWCGLVGWLALAAARSGPLGLRTLGTWVGATALLLCAVQGPRHRVRATARRVAQLVGGAAALWAVGEYVAGARGLQVHGGQGNPNWLGLLLALTLPLALEPAPGGRRRLAGLAQAALVALQVAGLYLSHSRVAWAAATVAGLLMIGGRPRAPGWVRPAMTAAMLLFLGLAAPLPSLGSPAAPPALAKAGPDGDAATGDKPLPIAWAGRLWIWQTSLAAATHELPLGTGLGGFAAAYLDAQGERLAGLPPRAASRRFLNATTAHNDWLELAVEGGPVALLLLLATWGSASLFYGAGRGVRWRAGSAVLVAGAICATGDSPLEQPAFLIVLVLVLAASPQRSGGRLVFRAANSGGTGSMPMASRRAMVALRCLVLLSVAMLLAPAVSAWLGARLSSRARDAAPVQRAALLARAARVDPRSGEIALARGLDALLLGEPAAALPELQRARGLLANIGTDVAIGNAELGLGHPGAAVAAYRRALRRHPGSFRAHANLAMAYGQLGAQQEARTHLAIARALQPGHPKLAEMAQQLAELAASPPSPTLP